MGKSAPHTHTHTYEICCWATITFAQAKNTKHQEGEGEREGRRVDAEERGEEESEVCNYGVFQKTLISLLKWY